MTDNPVVRRWQEAGFFDPDAPNAAAMAEVFEFFDSLGLKPEEFVGTDPEWIIRTANERTMRPGPRFSAEEFRTEIGLSPAEFERLRRAANYSAVDEFTELDRDAFSVVSGALTLFSFDELLAFVRVVAAAAAHMADAATALFRIDVASDIEARGGSELEYAKNNYAASQLMDPLLSAIKAFFLHELMRAARRSDQARQVSPDSEFVTLRLAVGFVDLAGYTPLAGGLSPRALKDFVARFEEQAFDVVSARDGRVVKLIGDEVMFVAVEAGDGFAIAHELLETFREMGAQPSGGVAYGDLVSRGGDYYGRVVNLAARLADLAIPGEILTDVDSAQATTGATFEPAGRRQLKGFEDAVSAMALLEIDQL